MKSKLTGLVVISLAVMFLAYNASKLTASTPGGGSCACSIPNCDFSTQELSANGTQFVCKTRLSSIPNCDFSTQELSANGTQFECKTRPSWIPSCDVLTEEVRANGTLYCGPRINGSVSFPECADDEKIRQLSGILSCIPEKPSTWFSGANVGGTCYYNGTAYVCTAQSLLTGSTPTFSAIQLGSPSSPHTTIGDVGVCPPVADCFTQMLVNDACFGSFSQLDGTNCTGGTCSSTVCVP